jgi:hypothetical protein
MSLGKISSKTDILQDPFETGPNYTGVTNLVTFGGGQPVRYGFILAKSASNLVAPGLSSLVTGSKQVVLSLNPQQISQDEPAATLITHTQNAGKYIERRGQISKTISIQGTTGYLPTPALSVAGYALNLPASGVVALEGPSSGLAQFLTLRALFREYWQVFSDEQFIAFRPNTYMIWVNGKDDENWIVEPMSFAMNRTSPNNRFTYNYSITMQTIAPVEAITFDPDPLTIFQNVGNTVAQLTSAYNTITTGTAAIGNALSLASGAVAESLGAVANLATSIASSLQNVIQGVESFISIPLVIKGQADDITHSYMGALTQLLTVRDYAVATYGVDPLPATAHAAMINIAETLADLSSRSELFSSDFPNTWQQTLAHYTPAYGYGGYNQDLVAPLTKSGVVETTVLPGDTLQNISIRELGNAERFMELAVLNSLKPPYLSPNQQDRAPNTLAPGDPILVPSAGQSGGARALIRTTVFTDPVFTSVVTGYSAPRFLTVDTRGKDFRTDQWAGFTADLIGPGMSAGGYEPPDGWFFTTLAQDLQYVSYEGNLGCFVILSTAVVADLPYSNYYTGQGYLILGYGTASQMTLRYLWQGPNLFDAVSTNISTGTDTLSNTTGFVVTALSGGGAIYNDTTPGATLASSTAQWVHGSHSLAVTASNTLPQTGVRTISISVLPNTAYTVSFRIMDPGAVSGEWVSVWAVDQTGAALFNNYFALSSSWTPYYMSFVTNSSTTDLQFFVCTATILGITFYLDDFQLTLGSDDIPVWNSSVMPQTTIFTANGNGDPYLAGTTVLYSVDGDTVPPNQSVATPFNGPVGIVVSNTANTLTVDADIAGGGPENGDIVRIHLVRPPNDVTPPKSSQEQLLGVDLKLNGADLASDSAGGLVQIDSTANVMQAIGIKIRTMPGDLAAHPTFGLAFEPGAKVSPTVLFSYRVAVKQTLLADQRIDAVHQLSVTLINDVLSLRGWVLLTGSSQPYAIDTRGAT